MTGCAQPAVGLGIKPARLEWRAHAVAGRCQRKSPAAPACTGLGPIVIGNHRLERAQRSDLEARRYREISGAARSARARARAAAQRLILMGDWRDLYSAPTHETPGAIAAFDSD